MFLHNNSLLGTSVRHFPLMSLVIIRFELHDFCSAFTSLSQSINRVNSNRDEKQSSEHTAAVDSDQQTITLGGHFRLLVLAVTDRVVCNETYAKDRFNVEIARYSYQWLGLFKFKKDGCQVRSSSDSKFVCFRANCDCHSNNFSGGCVHVQRDVAYEFRDGVGNCSTARDACTNHRHSDALFCCPV